MFDLHGIERLTYWKNFREKLETSNQPFQDTLDLWKYAPFVSNYINPKKVLEWPDPWHLVLDNKYDSLATSLGILYTLKLTRRFMESPFEIHMSINDSRDLKYFLIIENHVLNYDYGVVSMFSESENYNSEIVFSGKVLP